MAEKLQEHRTTPLQYLGGCFPKVLEHNLSMQLASFGVTQKMMQQPMAELSGGQRMRVAFAHMGAEEPHILILDEPTNHLDIYTIDALIAGLVSFDGGVVVASHNRHFLGEVAEDIIDITEKGFKMEKLEFEPDFIHVLG